MIAISSRFDDTTIQTGWNKTVATTITYINQYKEDYEYEPDYLQEEREMVRSGWYNPRKTPILAQHLPNRIKLQIRNQLPYKIRAVDNIL